MITGGSEAAITHMGLGGFASMRALSTRNDDPTRASRPFDRDRDGFILAEGAGILILEAEELARRRGARIYAEVVGYGMSADGWHITAPDEEGRGAVRAMNACLKDARLAPDGRRLHQCSRYEHAARRPGRDPGDEAGFRKSCLEAADFQHQEPARPHCWAPRAGSSSIISALAIHNGVLPPTINLDHPGEGCDLDYIPNVARETRVDTVMSNSFGFGGHNASLLIRRYSAA